MRHFGWFLLLVLMGATLVACGWAASSMGLALGVCRVDDEIGASERVAISTASSEFMALVRDGETEAALERMSRLGREATPRVTLLDLTNQLLAAPGRDASMQRVYELYSIGSLNGFAPCNSERGTAFVSRGAGFHSMVALITEQFDGGERTWTLWFEREDDAWKVRGAHFGLSAAAGRDGAELWALGQEQRRLNHWFNATLLFDLANVMLNRGGFFQAEEANGFAAARDVYRRHEDVAGANARFNLAGQIFSVAHMRATGTGDNNLVLVLDQAADEPVTVDEAIVRNRAFIDALNQHRAEWRLVFDAIAVGYPTGPNRVWRTVYDAETGYSAESATL